MALNEPGAEGELGPMVRSLISAIIEDFIII
jgi:hypothetical protein